MIFSVVNSLWANDPVALLAALLIPFGIVVVFRTARQDNAKRVAGKANQNSYHNV
jgi:hypothetical protein